MRYRAPPLASSNFLVFPNSMMINGQAPWLLLHVDLILIHNRKKLFIIIMMRVSLIYSLIISIGNHQVLQYYHLLIES